MEKIFEKRNSGHECRALENDGKRYIEGYAILYDHRSKLITEWGQSFFEVIKRGALDEVLADPELDVILTPNHDYAKVIARTKSKTLELVNDEKGLMYRAEVPNLSYANDIYESIKRGDTFESSFTFRVDEAGQNWTKIDEDIDLREIDKLSELIELAPVTWGAYADTAVAARALKTINEKREAKEVKEIPIENFQKMLDLKRLKK